MGSECNLSFQTVLLKLEAYCAYQDRCTFEVQQKLDSFQLSFEDHHKIIQKLTDNRFLDDLRFAESYCSGKFRIKKWGRLKIRQGLIQKRISKDYIQVAFQAIDPDVYWNTLVLLAERKWNEISLEKDLFKRKVKVMRFLAQRGFEQDLIYAALEEVEKA